VRRRILGEREEEVIRRYLEDGLMLEGFRVAKHRARSVDIELLERQLRLLRRFLERLEEEGGG